MIKIRTPSVFIVFEAHLPHKLVDRFNGLLYFQISRSSENVELGHVGTKAYLPTDSMLVAKYHEYEQKDMGCN